MFKNMKIGVRLALGFSVVLLLLAAVAAIGVIRLSDLNGDINFVVNDKYPKTAIANDIIKNALANARIVRSLIILTDPAELASNKANYDKNTAANTRDFDQLEKIVSTDKARELLKVMQTRRDAYRAYTNEVIEFAMAGKKQDAAKVLFGAKHAVQDAYLRYHV